MIPAGIFIGGMIGVVLTLGADIRWSWSTRMARRILRWWQT